MSASRPPDDDPREADEVGCPICTTYWVKTYRPFFLVASIRMVRLHMREEHPDEWAREVLAR